MCVCVCDEERGVIECYKRLIQTVCPVLANVWVCVRNRARSGDWIVTDSQNFREEEGSCGLDFH